MTNLHTYALLAVVAAWPAFALDYAAVDQTADPPAPAIATTSSAPIAPVAPIDDQEPPPPPPPPPAAPPAPPAAAAPKVTSQKVTRPEAATAPRAPAPPAVPAPPAAARSRQLVNVDVEVSLVVRSDTPAAPRTVKLRVADDQNGQYRQDMGRAVLNVDVRPSVVDASRTSVSLAIEVINPSTNPSAMELNQMRSRLEVLLKNGEPTTVSQWSDGTLNRSIDIIVKATQVR